MQRTEKRVVQHIGITRLQRVGTFDHRCDRVAHCRDMDERAYAGGDEFGIRRKQPDIVVVAFDHDGRGRYRFDGEALFVVDLPQAVLDDFESDGIDHGAACGMTARLPYGSIVAVAPGGSHIVVVSRSMTAGP